MLLSRNSFLQLKTVLHLLPYLNFTFSYILCFTENSLIYFFFIKSLIIFLFILYYFILFAENLKISSFFSNFLQFYLEIIINFLFKSLSIIF